MRSTGIAQFDARLITIARRKDRLLGILRADCQHDTFDEREIWAQLLSLALMTALTRADTRELAGKPWKRRRGRPSWEFRMLYAIELLRLLYEESTGKRATQPNRTKAPPSANAAQHTRRASSGFPALVSEFLIGVRGRRHPLGGEAVNKLIRQSRRACVNFPLTLDGIRRVL